MRKVRDRRYTREVNGVVDETLSYTIEEDNTS